MAQSDLHHMSGPEFAAFCHEVARKRFLSTQLGGIVFASLLLSMVPFVGGLMFLGAEKSTTALVLGGIFFFATFLYAGRSTFLETQKKVAHELNDRRWREELIEEIEDAIAWGIFNGKRAETQAIVRLILSLPLDAAVKTAHLWARRQEEEAMAYAARKKAEEQQHKRSYYQQRQREETRGSQSGGSRQRSRATSEPPSGPSAWLKALGLTAMPKTQADLKKAYRQRMLEVHPDSGRNPNHDLTVAANAAYDALRNRVPA